MLRHQRQPNKPGSRAIVPKNRSAADLLRASPYRGGAGVSTGGFRRRTTELGGRS